MRLALIAAAALVATPAFAQDARPAAYTNAEACLRENAPAAVRASSGAADAAEFLLQYLCAGPVGAAGAYQMNSASLEAMRGLMTGMSDFGMEDEDSATETVEVDLIEPADAGETVPPPRPSQMQAMADMFDGISVDPVSGELVVAPGAKGAALAGSLRAQSSATSALLGNHPPVFLRELAGRLVLELRR